MPKVRNESLFRFGQQKGFHRTSTGMPFGVNGTYQLMRVHDGVEVAIEEIGTISDPFFRFFAKFVLGRTSAMETYISKLAAAVDEHAEHR